MLNGKCKKDFDAFYKNKVYTEKEYLLIESNFYELPFSMQFGVYVDFFDSVGLYVDVLTEFEYTREFYEDKDGKSINPHYVPDNWYFTINDKSHSVGHGNYNNTRPEARKAAIEQANLIYNK